MNFFLLLSIALFSSSCLCKVTVEEIVVNKTTKQQRKYVREYEFPAKEPNTTENYVGVDVLHF
jgi:hypothetical protein